MYMRRIDDDTIQIKNKSYKTYEALLELYPSLNNIEPTTFGSVFGGTQQHKDKFGNLLYYDSDGNISTDSTGTPYMYPAIATAAEVWSLFLLLYSDAFCSAEYGNTYGEIGYMNIHAKLQYKISMFNKLYGDKYRRLLDTYFYEYNPIENYSMTESGTDKIDYTGQVAMNHSLTGDVDYTELSGPAVSGSAIDYSRKKQTSVIDNSTTNVSQNVTYNSSVSDNGSTDTTERNASGTQNTSGGKLSISTEGKPSIGSGGTTPETTHYTTTFDSTTEYETGKDTTVGDAASLEANLTTSNATSNNTQSHTGTDNTSVGTNVNGNVTTSEDLVPELRIVKGATEPAYTDITSYTNRNDLTTHNFTRSGNIGVTTAQQMIRSERELHREVLITEYLEDLSKYLTLGIY